MRHAEECRARSRWHGRIGAQSGFVTVIEDPLRDGFLGGRHGQQIGGAAAEGELSILRQKYHDAGAEDFLGERGGGSGGLKNTGFGGEPAGQTVQGFGAGLAHGGLARVLPQSGGLGADDQRDRQHPGKGEDVLIIGDGEGQIRRHAKEVEGRDAQKRSGYGDPAAAAHGDGHHPAQIDHGEIGGGQGIAQEHRGDGGDRRRWQPPERLLAWTPQRQQYQVPCRTYGFPVRGNPEFRCDDRPPGRPPACCSATPTTSRWWSREPTPDCAHSRSQMRCRRSTSSGHSRGG